MPRPFLEAHWSHLCLISYEVPPETLRAHVPRGLELDTRDGKAFVSLVAFDFENARVKGVAWPFHADFPEVNLRFYVRQGRERGVCFIREFVPKRLVSWIAGRIYNEPYRRCPMESNVHRTSDGLEVDHKFRVEGKWHTIKVATTRDPPLPASEDSWEHWFKEHTWGFGRDRLGATVRYRVVHPQWQCYRVEWAEVRVDWAKVYGPEWKFLKHAKPFNTTLAEGSEVAVFPAGLA